MDFSELVRKSRSYRVFDESRRIPSETLRELVELTRYAPSGANMQPLRYLLISSAEQCGAVFPSLAWAGYLQTWPGPEPGERPVAYIIMLLDTEVSRQAHSDVGIAAQTIMLGAAERGIGGCMLGAVRREAVRETLKIPDRYEIALVLALGYPAETVVIEEVGPDGDIKYYRDEVGVHHVPKRGLDELIVSFR